MAHLAVVVPGGNLFLSAVLRVPAVALAERGAQLVNIEPPLGGHNRTLALDDNRAYFDGVGGQIQQAIDGGSWDTVTFVAKSIGTAILSAVGTGLSLPPEVRALWLTPLFGLDYVSAGAAATGWPSLVVSGSADRWYDAGATAVTVEALGADHLLVEGADHNLEIAGNITATVDALRDLADATLTFG